MANYLITGGAGFIGSHLCDELVKDNTVLVLDNLSSGRLENLPEGVHLIKGDVRDYALVEELMSQVDGCFHLAAVVSIPLCNEDFLKTHAINVTGTMNILQSSHALAKHKKPVPIVFASTCAVYGDSKTMPMKETGPVNPISLYAATKIISEYYGRFMNEMYQVPFTSLRLFNVYGPRQPLDSSYSGVISIFLNALLHGNPCIFYGDGNQSRDFIYVKDVVKFFIQAMTTVADSSRVYNVCTGKDTSIAKIAALLSQALKKDYTIEHEPPKIGDIYNALGSPVLASKELGIKAAITIKAGIKDFITAIRESRP